MTLEITNAKDMTEEKATYLIYGNQGVGKTSSIKHIPGRTLIIDIDKSSIVLKGEEDIDVVSIDTHGIWDSWTKTAATLLTTNLISKYDNLVIDNVSELFRATLANLGRDGKNNRVPSMADYQRVDFTILDSLRALKKLPIRLIFTAWETSDQWETESGQTYNRSFPDLRKPISNNFMGLCDVVARLTISHDTEGNEKRGFILQPTHDVFAKNRIDARKGCLVEDLVVSDD